MNRVPLLWQLSWIKLISDPGDVSVLAMSQSWGAPFTVRDTSGVIEKLVCLGLLI